MRTRSRARLTAPLVALALAAALLAGCSGESGDDEGGPDTESEVPAGGDAPGAAVLPDDLSVSPDGGQVLADCWDGICRWDTADGSLAQVDDGSHVAVSPDWSLIAGVGDGATVLLLDAETRDVVQELSGHEDEEVTDGSSVTEIAFSPDGSLVASAGLDDRVIVWSVDDGAEVMSVETVADVARLAFSPDGTRLALTGGAMATVLEVSSGDGVATLAPSAAGSSALAWSPDGRWLVTSGSEGTPMLWRTSDFALADQLPGSSLERAAFSPDSTTLAFTDTEDDTVRLWAPTDLGGNGEVRELLGHTDDPEAVAFAPDGATLYSVSGGDGVLAWDVRGGKLRQELELPER